MKNTIPSGILFIGDPHCWSKKPGRRRDSNFSDTVLGKIEQASKICVKKNLFPIFLGDLFHKDDEHDITMLVKISRILKKFPYGAIIIDGNHDKKDATLNDSNALTLLDVNDRIKIINGSNPYGVLELKHNKAIHKVIIGGSSYGEHIPSNYKEAFGEERREDIDTALWLTHEDLDFDGSYFGAIPIRPISDVEMVVNGHIHATKKPVKSGETVYYNPGNITRLSIDQIDHVPSVWEWNPFEIKKTNSASGVEVTELLQHVLEHVPSEDIFNFEGRHTKDTSSLVILPEDQSSAFVKMAALDEEKERSDDGIYTEQNIHIILDKRQTAESPRSIVLNLFQSSIKKHQEQK